MTLFPVVERELRVAARRAFTYWGRALAGAVALGVIAWLVLLETHSTPQEVGHQIFTVGAVCAFVFALAAGSAFSSDSISSERREGTLGLLFLTDLRGRDIAVGKLLATSLGCVSYLLAAMPVLAVALLLGGVSGSEAMRILLVLLNTLFFSLNAGLLASTFTQTGRTASTLAGVITLLGAVGVPALGFLGLIIAVQLGMDNAHLESFMQGVFSWPAAVAPMVTGFEQAFRRAGGAALYWAGTVFTHLLGWGCFLLAAWRLPRIWQETARAAATPRSRAAGSGPGAALRTRLLELGPMVWLAERNRWRRRWVWVFLGAVAVGFGVLAALFRGDWVDAPGYLVTSLVLHLVLKFWIATEAPRQFFDDRRSGAMELLLATPLTVDEILRGRFLAIERHFLGPLLTVSGVDLLCLFASLASGWDNDAGEWMVFWVARAVLLWADAVALAWTGMWVGLTVSGSRAASGAFWRVILLPWGVTFLLGTFLGVARALDQWGFGGFLAAWVMINLANAAFWVGRSRGALRSEFRDRAAGRTGSHRDPGVMTARPEGAAAVGASSGAGGTVRGP